MIPKEEIKLLASIPLIEVISNYVTLKSRGSSMAGKCPVCNREGFIVTQKKGIFKCFACGIFGHDVIHFVKLVEKLDFVSAFNFIKERYDTTINFKISSYHQSLLTYEEDKKCKIRGTVYVLGLQDDCFYVGFTQNFKERIKEHFLGIGTSWTTLHPPLTVRETFNDKCLSYENYLTEKYIDRYGYERVRGGDHLYFHRKYHDRYFPDQTVHKINKE